MHFAFPSVIFFLGRGKFRRSGYCGFYFGVAVLFCRVCTHVHLDGPTAAALLSIAFLSYKKGTHEKDMGEEASAKRLGG